jgi:23S rRNA (uracil1939-C5)-methyltransferase
LSLQTIELTIDRLSFNGGRGVGRFDGVVVFVPDTAPGDFVRARVTVKKSNLWEAELVEILKPSPYRRNPPCPVAGVCGGCAWQHVEYAEQLKQKQEIVEFALKQKVEPVIPSPNELRYRNRVQVHIENGKLGFFAKRSNDLVAITDCLITEEAVTAQFSRAIKSGESRVELSLDTNGFFSQVNSAQNRKLIEVVLSQIEGSPQKIADLYAGYGNLTAPLTKQFPQAEIVAVELNERAVEKGRTDLPEVKWFREDVGDFLQKAEAFDVVVLDPPRTGCANPVINALRKMKPEQIVYVSCNPMTFARDAKRLMEAGVYRLDLVQPLDMFPQTEHIELVAKFSRLSD